MDEHTRRVLEDQLRQTQDMIDEQIAEANRIKKKRKRSCATILSMWIVIGLLGAFVHWWVALVDICTGVFISYALWMFWTAALGLVRTHKMMCAEHRHLIQCAIESAK